MAGHSYEHARKVNISILGALLGLTLITVAAAGINFGSPSANTVVALVIASVKASLVALFFMHLKYDKPINAIIFLVGILTLAIFLIFVLLDADSRHQFRPANLAPPRGGPEAAAKVVEIRGTKAVAPEAPVAGEPAPGH